MDKREIKPLLNQVIDKINKERGVLIPLEPKENVDDYYGLLVNKIIAKYLHKSKMDFQKLLAKYHIKVKKCSRKAFKKR